MSAQPDAKSARFPADTPFSYHCGRCRRCCHDKLIQVNPYEVARLARNRGVTTTQFLRDNIQDGVYLRRVERGACVFLGPAGCTVHADRPLVCRLYPIGRHVTGPGGVEFSQLEAHPQSEGIYGRDRTVADYLAGQGIEAFVKAADYYLELLRRLNHAWWEKASAPVDAEPGSSDEMPDLMDMDAAIVAAHGEQRASETTDLEQRMCFHVDAIDRWVERQVRG